MQELWESEDEEKDDDLSEDESLLADDPDFSIDEQGHAAVPDGLTSIADGAFLGCRALASINKPPRRPHFHFHSIPFHFVWPKTGRRPHPHEGLRLRPLLLGLGPRSP